MSDAVVEGGSTVCRHSRFLDVLEGCLLNVTVTLLQAMRSGRVS